MSETAPKPELMRSLGRLVRGLSALFWGLPIALVVCVQTANTGWLDSLGHFGLLVPVAATALLFYALHLMSDFQKQERIWVLSLDRAKIAGLVNIGLAPFLHWHQRLPDVPFFSWAVSVMALSGLVFLFNLNLVLQRLTAMLPDETLREETKVFTSLNSILLVLIPTILAAYFGFSQMRSLPHSIALVLRMMEPLSQWMWLFLILLLILLPMAITMSLIWKIKEAILASVFGPEH
jgi:hypothetical protein